MAVSSPTQDQGLAGVKPGSLGRFSMCFPYFGFKHGNSRITSPSKNSVIEVWTVFCAAWLQQAAVWKGMSFGNPAWHTRIFQNNISIWGHCVCAMSHALLQSGLRRMPFHFQYRLVSTIYLGILSTPGCRTAFRYNGHSMRCWYLDVHPRNGLQEERYWYVEKSSLESSALRTSSSSGLCNGLYGLYLMIIVAPPHKWCVDVYIFTIYIIQTSLLDNS